MMPRPDIALCSVSAKSRTSIVRALPSSYFADAPTLAESENRGRTAAHTAGAASREAAGESDSVTTHAPAGSDAGQETRSLAEAGGAQLSGATHGAGTGVTAGAGPSSAPVRPGLASLVRHAAGLGSRAYAIAAQRITRGQQLRAARLLFGRRSPA